MTNPYAFVPLGDLGPERREPRGHDQLGRDGLSGSFMVDVRVLSPLVLGGFPGAEDVPPRAIEGSGNADSIVPGSTLAGAVRSIHEALTSSCLRVVDLDYVPVHRAPLTTNEPARTLALVLESAQGIPTVVRPLGRMVAIDAEVLQHGWSHEAEPAARVHPPSEGRGQAGAVPPEGHAVWRTGDRLSISGMPAGRAAVKLSDGRAVAEVGVKNPITMPVTITAEADGEWLLVISDTKTRDSRVWWRLLQVPKNVERVKVDPNVGLSFARALEDADDLHRLAGLSDRFVNVYWPQDAKDPKSATIPVPVLGQRLRLHPDTYSEPGTPVWIQWDGNTRRVKELRVSQVWRRTGDGQMADRVRGHEPCRGQELCPSCRLFGSAGYDDRPTARAAEQNSYAGHVRFADASWHEQRSGQAGRPVVMETFERAPLASPKPTAGQFYLQPEPSFVGRTSDNQPLAQWGSAADDGESPRPIAGRKFYWATESSSLTRGRRQDGDSEELTATVAAIRPGSVFSTRVTFDNLDRRQLAELLISIDPGILWHGARSRIGGGRPFGWGTVHMRIDEGSLVADGPARYTAERPAASEVSVADLLMEYRASHGTQPPPHWDALRAVLTPDWMNDATIAYPTQNGDPFEFWQGTSGWKTREKVFPLTVPPVAPSEGQLR